ncbi:hypothetical protein BJ878DRAFT_536438 [Calycina marina]|uniref:Phosphoribosylaminoimidazole-succinocarboxamide synthase protein n=1 Tax=Calycina marina TaxID=1763456 RepID=A0A9P8CC41_9HELO|nr:hypothetical protein BJ878DRAFT_536438 [Calycina marina]
MDLGQLSLQQVQQNRPQLQRVLTDEQPSSGYNALFENNSQSSITSEVSEPATVIPWETPPSKKHTPRNDDQRSQVTKHDTPNYSGSLRSSDDSSRTEIPPSSNLTSHQTSRQSTGLNEATYASHTPLVVRFDEEQIASNAVDSSKRDKMEVASLSSTPTPTDNTPYIRFAIDQLTRDKEIKTFDRDSSVATSDTYPVERVIPDLGLGYLADNRHTREELALARKHRSPPDVRQSNDSGRLFRFNATRPLSYQPEPPATQQNLPQQYSAPTSSQIYLPVPPPGSVRFPTLTLLPTILRPLSMIVLCLLCLLMIAAIIFCAVYSTSHQGLVAWSGVYSGRYFVFRFLPQIIAACILIYVQCVMTATKRMMPFVIMAAGDVASTNARYMNLYPQSLLWPRWNGFMPSVLFWFAIFTIPLQSCLFYVVPVGFAWKWIAVQGVAWTLVVLYLLLLVSAIWTGVFFFRKTTGLMWDPRSIADLIALLPRSNCLQDYPGTDVMATKQEIVEKLGDRIDRLGYWSIKKGASVFYCVGEQRSSTRRDTGRTQAYTARVGVDVEKETTYSRATRFRHIPWFLRDAFVILWVVAAFILLPALIVISFLPSTDIRKGFSPLVPILPNTQGFSASGFLYSFVPSLLGMLLYLLFQPLDMALRILTPWAELGRAEGQTANKSLLLDYTTSLPFICTLKAVLGGHFRVALLSFLSTIFIIIPILAGGLFFPLTTSPTFTVRMIPNLPAFYILLSLLILYLIGLLTLLPNRKQFHLPHPVTCLAEVFSFMHNSPVLGDVAFNNPRSKSDLVTRLLALNAAGQEKTFAFGVYIGRDGKECFGVERLGRRGQEVVILDPVGDGNEWLG